MTDDLDALIQAVLARTRTEACRKAITDLLLEICRIDTTPNSDVNVMRAAESDVFDVLERELAELSFAQARSERRCIDPAIAGHPAFSLLHFTKTADRPGGLTPEQAYAGRGNLVWVLPGCNAATNARGVAVNAHIDVVAPYFPPHLDKGIVYGRGACDDKGQVVAILAALRVLSEVLARNDRRFVNDIVAMFVIEEEPGGNGSLTLAVDRKLKELYDSVLEAYRHGWRLIKLYFMIGLPGEQDEHVDAIIEMASKVSDLRTEVRKGRGQVNVSVASFVPKPHTPLQWTGMQSMERLRELQQRLLSTVRLRAVRLKFHKVERSLLEAVLARGDRRVGAAIYEAWRRGARFDAWDETFDVSRWLDAFDATGIDPAFYAHRERPLDEVLPWQHISCGVSDKAMLAEEARSQRGELTTSPRFRKND